MRSKWYQISCIKTTNKSFTFTLWLLKRLGRSFQAIPWFVTCCFMVTFAPSSISSATEWSSSVLLICCCYIVGLFYMSVAVWYKCTVCWLNLNNKSQFNIIFYIFSGFGSCFISVNLLWICDFVLNVVYAKIIIHIHEVLGLRFDAKLSYIKFYFESVSCRSLPHWKRAIHLHFLCHT